MCNEGDKEKTLNPSKVRSMTLKDVYGRFVGQPVLVSSDENAVFLAIVSFHSQNVRYYYKMRAYIEIHVR